MKVYEKSHKLDHVCYDIRGPIMEEANRMIAGGEDVLKLNIGNPAYFGFRTPEVLLDYMADKLPDTEGYSDSHGLVSAREAICEYCREKGIPNVGINDVFTGNGVSELITLSMQGLLDNGDEVLVPTPDYPLWTASVTLAGGKAVHYICDEQSNWYPDIEDMRRKVTDKTKGIVVINPNNPTGAVMSAAEMEKIAAVLRETKVLVLSDEIYSELTYGLDRHVSIASLPGMAERTVVVNGFSKSYAMTGWRLGYAAGPAPLIKVMTKIHQSCIMSAPTTSQYAAVTALRQCDDQIEMMRDEYNRRRRYVVKSLNDMGLTCFEPRGAFYVFPSIQISGLTSSEFCEQLLREKEVAIIPGSAFGASGEGYARISYAYSVDHLQIAMKRIREFLSENGWTK